VEGAIPITAEITASARHDLALAVGASTWVSVKATEIEVFSA
jgi:molybdopterin-binding protein